VTKAKGFGCFIKCNVEQPLKGEVIDKTFKEMKTVPIEFKQVVDSYAAIRRGGKATGVDNETVAMFEKELDDNLYLIYNRLASGSYHPPAIRQVDIPKKDGKMRVLGVPTLRDKIAQHVIKVHMERVLDPMFHEDSYGYRPMKRASDAIKKVQENCYQYDWVIDLDIKSFFDELDHELLLTAVSHVFEEKWVLRYVERWLKAPMQTKDGDKIMREKGTPQGGVISPLLANLFLHYTLDKWLGKYYPEISFVRYADDIVIHCRSKEEAEAVLVAVKARLEEVKLRVNENKTHISYCKDYRRKEKHGDVRFEFLGFSYEPRTGTSTNGKRYLTYTPEISSSNQKRIKDEIRAIIHRRNQILEISDFARLLNPKIRGWIAYYGQRYKRVLHRTLAMIDQRLITWLMIKHKSFYREAVRKLHSIQEKNPHMFTHWNSPFGRKSYKTARAV
jgi:RNA-directed DNA polymerase